MNMSRFRRQSVTFLSRLRDGFGRLRMVARRIPKLPATANETAAQPLRNRPATVSDFRQRRDTPSVYPPSESGCGRLHGCGLKFALEAGMTDFGIDEWMVAWAPNKTIEVGPWPDKAMGWLNKYSRTSGCCWLDRHSMDLAGKLMMMFIDFHTCIVRDGINQQLAHNEFLKIGEYRRRISPDTSGASE
jgi:hypothetical protein